MRAAFAATAVLALLMIAGCPGTRVCKPGTLLVNVTLGAAAASASTFEVDVSLAGGAPRHTSFARGSNSRTGTIEIDFPSGYPAGKPVTVTVTASQAGQPVAAAVFMQTLAASCATATVALNDTSALADMSMPGMMPDMPDMTPVADLTPPADMTCVFQSAEDCFNGIDDDCNGFTDCADPACTSGSECVPAAGGAGFALGTTVGITTSCPSLYSTKTDVHQGLSGQGGVDCTGCSCTATVSCSASLYVYANQTACTNDMNTLSGGSLIGTVTNANAPAMCNAHTFTVGDTYRVGPYTTVSNACVASGASAKTTPMWTTDNRFCQVDKIGAGCSPGYVCVPKVTTPHCALASGAQSCQPGYTPMGTWFTGFSDTRNCGSCGCGTQTPGNCSHDANNNPTYFQIFFGGCGSGINNNHPPNSQQCVGLNNADMAYGWESGQFFPVAPSCPATYGETGALTTTGQQTLCCK
jgi:hypothetical protein